MLNLIITGATAYISTSIDYLIILMLLFGRAKNRRDRWAIYWGDLLGTSILVGTALIMAFVLHFVPATWLLGFLGLVPIYLGIRLLIEPDDDDQDAIQQKIKHQRSLMLNVILITASSCGADNIGIYVPLFVPLSAGEIGVVLLTFLVMLSLFCLIGYELVRLPRIAAVLGKYGRWISAIVYLLLGLYVMWESGTFSHLFGW